MNRFLLILSVVFFSSIAIYSITEEKSEQIEQKLKKMRDINLKAGGFQPAFFDLPVKINQLRSETDYKDIDWKSFGPFQPANTAFPNPEVNGNGRINDIEFDPFDSNKVWIGTNSGGLWNSSDKGQTWQLNYSSDILSMGVTDIELSTKEKGHIYIVTGDPKSVVRYFSIGVIKSTDNGQTWENIFSFDQEQMYQFKDIELFEGIDLMVAASNKGFFKSKISEIEWQPVLENESFADIESVIDENLNIYVSTYDFFHGDSKIYLSTDSAKTFKAVREYDLVENIELEVNQQTNNIYAVTSDSRFHKLLELIYSNDNGETWNVIADSSQHLELIKYQGFFNLLISINPLDSNDIFVGGVDLYRTKDHGKTWIKQKGLHVDQHDLIFDNENEPYSANDGGIYKLLDSNNWQNLSNGLNITQVYGLRSHPLTDKYINIGTQDNGWQYLHNDLFNAKFAGDFINAIYHPDNSDLIFYTLPRGNVVYSSLSGNAELITPEYFERRPWFTEIIYSDIYKGIMTGGTNLHLNITVNNGYENIQNQWTKLTNFNDTNKIYSIVEANNDLFFTREGLIYKINADTTLKLHEFDDRINEMEYFEDESAFYIGFENYSSGDAIYRIKDNDVQNYTFNLPAITVNAIEKIDNQLLIGTNAGVYILDDEKWHYYGDRFPPAVVTELEYDKENNLLNASTFGRGIWQVRFNECQIEKPFIRTQKEYYCKNEEIVLEIVDPVEGYSYKWWDGSEGITKVLGSNFTKYYSLFAIAYNQEGCNEISNIINFQIDDTADIKLFLLSRNPICEGDSAVIYAARDDDKFGDYFWNNGDDNDTLVTYEGGTFYHYYRTVNDCYSYSDSIMIEVVKKPMKPQISQDGIRLISSDANRYLWFKNNERIPSSNTKALKIESPGEYKVRVFNESGCYFDSEVFEISLSNITDDFEYSIKPNPVLNNINFEIFLESEQDISIKIFDLAGRKFFEKDYKSLDGYYSESYDLSELSQGVYLIEIKSDNVKKYSKFIKIK